MDITSQPWFPWTVGLMVGVPVLVVALSELHLRLQRSGNSLAGPVNRLRIWLIPLSAVLFLLTRGAGVDGHNNGVRIVATIVGTLSITIALGAMNAALFGNATVGTWRERLPSIFVDLGRLVLVVTGAAIVASYVWGLDVGGWFAALGVGSIVIGLALQNAIGSVVSGLLLLFEQPFRIGDTLEVGGVEGRVVEMNWRSTHLDTGAGIQIIPNATIAGASFANLARPTPAHDLGVESAFGAGDDPEAAMRMLLRVAADLPVLRPDGVPTVRSLGGGRFVTTLPLATAGDSGDARSLFTTWLWYAARRAGLHVDGGAPEASDPDAVSRAVTAVTGPLSLRDDDRAAIVAGGRIETFGEGETVLAAGSRPTHLAFVLDGIVRLLTGQDTSRFGGAEIPLDDLERGEVLGEALLGGDRAATTARAASLVRVLLVPREVVDQVVLRNHVAARRLNEIVDLRVRLLADLGDRPTSDDAVRSPLVS